MQQIENEKLQLSIVFRMLVDVKHCCKKTILGNMYLPLQYLETFLSVKFVAKYEIISYTVSYTHKQWI